MPNKNTQTIRVTKQFTFDMAHALLNYDGDCKNIHGHTYKLSVTLQGKVKHEPGHPKDGMVIDFNIFKSIVKSNIISVFDHSLVLNKNTSNEQLQLIKQNFEKVHFVNFQPSCENLLLEFLQRINDQLPENVLIHSIRLDETPSSYAEWFRSDN